MSDLIAQDKANNLYRYDGKGNGTFAARVKLFTNWGGSYNVIVGVGDITDDGKSDLVSRDTSGNVYRNNGDGKGSFGSRTKIATGWAVTRPFPDRPLNHQGPPGSYGITLPGGRVVPHDGEQAYPRPPRPPPPHPPPPR
ncbi:VCBS repeat-containing protein, partial [Streptomyces fulvoviolaceus]|uniref:FG-GAP repeat domain-containing protein n=1 Tax=Streptomyces fulvoviolaceus TaxID=285535 RepID=UPI0030B83521